MSDPIDPLIEHAASLAFEDLDASDILHQKRRLLDNIACTLAGAHAHGVAELLGLFASEQTAGQATVLGIGRRLSWRAHGTSVMSSLLDIIQAPPTFRSRSRSVSTVEARVATS
jgi:2-methylcitrate dehydratase PrpD